MSEVIERVRRTREDGLSPSVHDCLLVELELSATRAARFRAQADLAETAARRQREQADESEAQEKAYRDALNKLGAVG